jgi:hypothetical protein
VAKFEPQLILHGARTRGHLPLHVVTHAVEQILDIADLEERKEEKKQSQTIHKKRVNQ